MKKPSHQDIGEIAEALKCSYFKILSDGPVGAELTTFRVTARCSTN